MTDKGWAAEPHEGAPLVHVHNRYWFQYMSFGFAGRTSRQESSRRVTMTTNTRRPGFGAFQSGAVYAPAPQEWLTGYNPVFCGMRSAR